ncbi:DUF445 domain-containing protein [Paenibacillus sp. CAA11]|uniref:DUF445 family protein n=1 Tax=Paenibacillus sp. CAA11 TaxID=1532905 RepID=UPI000D39F538|nr:DUF445 family protein [Paenibacillus sp. CAA11]AWB44052.1 DUF445 domain-containing protein [Paenibacillus sp. CAA11]
MTNGWYLLFSVAVAAFVGGFTNHLAIKMLFHPRKPIYIGSFRIPFTPGLIPKRREEIAESLGQVVSEYLVTAEGLQELVRRPAFQKKAEERLSQLLLRASQSALTLEAAAEKAFGQAAWAELKGRLEQSVRAAAGRAASRWWRQSEWESKSLKEAIPGWSDDRRRNISASAAEVILQAVEEELLSAQGQRMLTKLAESLMDQTGGFLGAMASFFVDEDKLVKKLTPALVRGLRGEEARAKVTQAIDGRLEMLGEKPVGELLKSLLDTDLEQWIEKKVKEGLPIRRWMTEAGELTLSSMISPWQASLQQRVGQIASRLLEGIARIIPSAVQSIELPKLVQEQVQKFPIERLEQVILSVSGREFRAITWLGVLLGAIIGLIQALMLMLVN